ncbi:hypothetical protein BDQ94DRAFT_148618 [Aspergillus welwitschiae]|uniref:Uncharacterized protein n=1 Tax=Aspergillus welwitschiae TaxID=1341132 RepID=A0A3F3PU89_9EURO|nr:hypothetical protein BDQ94DRAFT_148618 [Aspergillus welwitschiae]RDH30521.1 hypothetical protein BDQ94DRAFT_148618 [Aspergillus welwitschiae]
MLQPHKSGFASCNDDLGVRRVKVVNSSGTFGHCLVHMGAGDRKGRASFDLPKGMQMHLPYFGLRDYHNVSVLVRSVDWKGMQGS